MLSSLPHRLMVSSKWAAWLGLEANLICWCFSVGTGPRKVKLFSNRLHMGFDQAEDDPASQDIELKEADLADGATPTVLKLVKFQNLDSLTVRTDNVTTRSATSRAFHRVAHYLCLRAHARRCRFLSKKIRVTRRRRRLIKSSSLVPLKTHQMALEPVLRTRCTTSKTNRSTKP
jgi:hypothetical protein